MISILSNASTKIFLFISCISSLEEFKFLFRFSADQNTKKHYDIQQRFPTAASMEQLYSNSNQCFI